MGIYSAISGGLPDDAEGTIWEQYGESGNTEKDNFPYVKIVLLLIVLGMGAVWLSMATQGWGMYVGVRPGTYLIYTTAGGETKVIDEVGIHFKGLNKTWHYPTTFTSRHESPVTVTFYDGKSRGFKTTSIFYMPKDDDDRINLHIRLSANIGNLHRLVGNETASALRHTGPIFSSEDMSRGKGRMEFASLVDSQIREGLYETIKKEKVIDGKTVFSTEVVKVDDSPIVMRKPIYDEYGLDLFQFSITEMIIPPAEVAEMERKKQAYLMTLKAKEEGSKLTAAEIISPDK